MLSKIPKTSESASVKHAERHPVGGVVLTKITLEDEVIFKPLGLTTVYGARPVWPRPSGA